ncbi:MAG: hypothetical protein ABI614_24325, partial [Planctomycetota bacterium]
MIYNKTIAGRMTQQHLMDQLQQELLAEQMIILARQNLLSPDGLHVRMTPLQAWGFHNRMNRRVQTEMVALKVDNFKDKVSKMPTEAEIKQLYEEGKDRFPNRYSPEVAFKRRRQLGFEYVRADSSKLQEEEAAKIKDTITDEDIAKHYEENKVRYRVIEVPDSETEPKPVDAGSEAAPESSDKPADPATPETPPAPAPATEKPADEPAKEGAAKEDATPKPAAEEKETPEKPAASEPAPAPAADEPASGAPAATSEEKDCSSQDEPKSEVETAEPPTATGPAPTAEPSPAVPPADAPATPAVPAPTTENPPAATEAATTDPAAAKSADEAPTPTAETTEAAAEAKPAPTDAGVPAAAAPPDETRYKPLDDKLRAEIRDEITRDRARQPAQERLDKALDEIKSVIDAYGKKARRVDAAKPAPVDYEKLASEHGFTAGKIDPTDVIGIEQFELGKAYEMAFTSWPPQRVSFAQMAFQESVQMYRAQRIKSAELGGEFLYWTVAEKDAYVPQLEAIRGEVIEAWKHREAFVIAKAEAEKLAKQAAGDKPLGESLSEHDGLEIIQPVPFSWMSTGSTPFGGAGAPTLSQVEGVEAAGNDFMKSVFGLKQGQVGVAVDQPQAIVYVVRIAAETPSEEILKAQFLASGVTPEMSQIAFVEIEGVWQDWYKDLETEM